MTPTDKRVARFLMDEMNSSLSNLLLLKDEDSNEYFLFNRYYIRETAPGYQVTFSYNDEIVLFSSLKNALCFCIFDRANKHAETDQIKRLDLGLNGIDVSIAQLQKLLRKTKDTGLKLIYIAKLNEELLRKKHMKRQLSSFINMAKYYQVSKFKQDAA